jgi:hypothetical protein
MLRSFDDALVAGTGDARDHQATAEALRRELAQAGQDKASVVNVQCASAFCKATIEQDTAQGGAPLDINAFLDAVPSLKTEAMFEYQNEGTRKRITIYAARAGQLLPRQPTTDTIGAAASTAKQP